MNEKNTGKYTELELRERGIGKFMEKRTPEWATKLSTYHDEEVKRAYLAIKRSLDLLCTDAEGYQYYELAHKVAQIITDKYLLQRCKGMDVPVPGPVISASNLQSVPAAAKPIPSGLKPTAVMADFTKWSGKIDTISDINWIYNHLMVKDVRPEDAPSPGAWAHLQYHRSSASAMKEFFTGTYSRLIPSKSVIEKAGQKNDDGRATFSLLERLLKEEAGSAEPVPVLQLGDKEHPRLQIKAGQSAVPEESS